MSNEPEQPTIIVKSTRFGDMTVAADTVIEFPSGLIGFPKHRKFVMFDHKPPFAWLHSIEDSSLAFVVMDGSQFVQQFDMRAPFGSVEIDLKDDDEFAILIVVTVRSDPKFTTANLKAPLFVNIRNRKGTQVIYDDSKYPTRFHLWGTPEQQGGDQGGQPAGEPEKK